MSDNSRIQWTDATWNPAKGCTKISAGCDHCYAERMAQRLQKMGQENYADGFVPRELPHMLDVPLRWRKPRHVFVCSMGDLFHESISDGFIAAIFGVMACSPQHTFQVLTKRPERARQWFRRVADATAFSEWWPSEVMGCVNELTRRLEEIDKKQSLHGNLEWPIPNAWLGVTAENHTRACKRIPILLDTPAAVRFVSCEPLLSGIELDALVMDFAGYHGAGNVLSGEWWKSLSQGYPALPVGDLETLKIDWVIVGGESGPGARPMNPDWVRSLRDQCVYNKVPFFFKQWGEWAPDHTIDSRRFHDGSMARVRRIGKREAGCELDGEIFQQTPKRGE